MSIKLFQRRFQKILEDSFKEDSRSLGSPYPLSKAKEGHIREEEEVEECLVKKRGKDHFDIW